MEYYFSSKNSPKFDILHINKARTLTDMEIILIRHGESIGNALRGDEAVFTGRWDCDLTQAGYLQAEALRNCSLLDNVDIYYCSPLKRAVQTANAFLNAELVIDERIQERSLGVFEGKKIADVKSDPQYAKFFSDLCCFCCFRRIHFEYICGLSGR